ncbi:MAG: hypothetical protein JEZ10_09455, partial [Verrucomicrobia bacterium]|nr:hypothetical protein [Verrucomicrobiota bacterium]
MSHRPVIQAVYSSGAPDQSVWDEISPTRLAFSKDRTGVPQEGGTMHFVWNELGLYVRAELEDSCLIAMNRQDEQLHYLY